MPTTFHVTAPDGHTLEVTGPDGATEEQAIQQAQQMYNPAQMPKPAPATLLDKAQNVVGRGFGAAAENVNPMPLVRAAMDIPGTAKALVKQPIEAAGRAATAFGKGQYGEAAKSAVGAIPLVGTPAEQITREATGGQIPEALGHTAGFLLGPKLLRGVGKTVGAAAPALAESALGVRAINRAYGKTPGMAALEETSGFRPGTVAESAQNRLTGINQELEHVVGQSTNPIDIGPARQVLDTAEAKARGQNERKTVGQLEPMQQHLATDMSTRLPLSQAQSPSGTLALKRGFGNEFVHNWNPETMKGVKGTAGQTYHVLADALHQGVPESAALDERASSLIPVAERASARELQAPLGQRVAGRMAAHTGALLGGAFGYQHGGIPGGIAGLVAPELLASPTVQMAVARGLHGGGKILQKPIAGRALQTAPLLRREGDQ